MAHYAFIDDENLVTEVIVGRDEDDLAEGVTSWEDYYGAFRGQRCLRTSYNMSAGIHLFGGEPFRGNYAGIGFSYDAERDAFIPPKPFESWLLNEATCQWEAPIPLPSDADTVLYGWDEDAGNWVEVPEV
jgi:hypothetical protein